jgi:hypothetical protein
MATSVNARTLAAGITPITLLGFARHRPRGGFERGTYRGM